MHLTMHTATVPTCTRALNSLAAILEKAAAHARGRKINPAVLLGTRLFPDMLPLAMQIHIANDIAQGGAARLAGAPKFPPSKRRSGPSPNGSPHSRAPSPISSPEAGAIRGSRRQDHHWQTRTSTKSMQGTPYLFNHVLPNVFFHVTTAYDILRQSGLQIGKLDYLGRPERSAPGLTYRHHAPSAGLRCFLMAALT